MSENIAAGVSHKVLHKVFPVLVCHMLLELLSGAMLKVFAILNRKRFTVCKVNVTKTG